MKTVSLLLLAVLATLAWANPNYFPADDAIDQDPGYPQEYFEEYVEEQAYGTKKDATAQDFCNVAEIMAQSICVAITNNNGWVYAVQRKCTSSSGTCAQICTAPKLRAQDPQTRSRTWVASAALHVYNNRPSSAPGTAADPHIGLKVYRYSSVHTSGCGPNFCCCHAP